MSEVADAVVETPITSTTGLSQAEFGKWIGIDPDAFNDDAPVEDATGDVDAAAEPDATGDDTATDDESEDKADDAEPSDTDEPVDEPDAEPVPALPFAAKAKDEDVDAALLHAMEVTFKADGKDVTLPLADIVRRAQSEPAAQRKAQSLTHEMSRVQSQIKEFEAEVAEVRRVALQMARDPNYYAQVVQELEEYDAPESRAQRAESALAAERKAQQDAKVRADSDARLTEFASQHVAPTLDKIVGDSPLVSQEEILGKFFADTASITVNGVIPSEYHAQVAEYLRTDLAAFAADRQSSYAARDAKAKAEERKTQRERQAMKNTKAATTKPVGTPNALREKTAQERPRNISEASDGALNVLLNGLS